MAGGAARPPTSDPRLPTDAASHPSLWAMPAWAGMQRSESPPLAFTPGPEVRGERERAETKEVRDEPNP